MSPTREERKEGKKKGRKEEGREEKKEEKKEGRRGTYVKERQGTYANCLKSFTLKK
jgi:hypothetical protein